MSFKAVAARIASKEKMPQGNADAILAAASRNASPAAKKANPALKKVAGKSNNKNKEVAAKLLAARRKGKGKPQLDSDGDYDNGM